MANLQFPTTEPVQVNLFDDGVFDDLAGPEAAVVKVEYVTVDPWGQAESAVVKVEYVTVDPDSQAETAIATF